MVDSDSSLCSQFDYHILGTVQSFIHSKTMLHEQAFYDFSTK